MGSEQLEITFADVVGLSIPWTSYTFESDFMTPCDAFSFVLEGSTNNIKQDINNIVNGVSLGSKVTLQINGSTQMTGRVEHLEVSYTRDGGTRLDLKGRDLLGQVADATINPAIQANITSSPSSTFQQVFQAIFQPFGFYPQFNELDTGKDVSIASAIKTGAALAKSGSKGQIATTRLSTQIKHQYKPNREEGYLQYALRLAERNGWFIKSTVDGITINFYAPTYDRQDGPAKGLILHSLEPANPSNLRINNVKSSKAIINWLKQPTVIIAECNVAGGNFRRGDAGCIMVNDLTGYDGKGQVLSDDTGSATTDLQALISVYTGAGTVLVPPNISLQQVKNQSIIKTSGSGQFFDEDGIPVNTNSSVPPNRAMYIYDQDSMSPSELQFVVRSRMAKYNNDYLTLEYVLQGHIDPSTGFIWTPNTMVLVVDDTYGINGSYWIQKRTFIKTRGGGTLTHLTLRLPYCYTTGPNGS